MENEIQTVESNETPVVESAETKTVIVELNDAQYAFLTEMQKTHESELGIEVPVSALVRKIIERAMRQNAPRAEKSDSRPSGDRPRFGGGDRGGDRGARSGGCGGFGGGDRGGKPGFGGGRPSFGASRPMTRARPPRTVVFGDKK